MKYTIGLALFGALGFSTSSWADGLKFEHSFNGNTTAISQNLNAAGNVLSGNSANVNLNSNKSSSNSCAGICANGNKIIVHHSSDNVE